MTPAHDPAQSSAHGTACQRALAPRHAVRSDSPTPVQRRVLVGTMVALHAALAYGLLQVREVRNVVAEVAPIFVSLVAPPAPTPPTPPAPIRRTVPPIATPVVSVAPTPNPRPAPFTAAPALPEPDAAPAVPDPAPGPSKVPAAPAPPKTIPASAVQYLEAPLLEYPRASRRAGEAGRVVLRVYIDEAGLPRQVQVSRSSGFARLDEAAIAAVHKARFKPYSDNGAPLAGWALVPLVFDLEK